MATATSRRTSKPSRRGLPASFYDRPVVEVARELLGCVVEHAGASGVIIETEAYHHSEPASHAFAGLTTRTKTLFGEPGRAYVYRSYGIHALLNAVCEPEGVGAGVLIRALQPLTGLDSMRVRRNVGALVASSNGAGERALCSGPGKLTQALGIGLADNNCDLARGPVVIRARLRDWRDPEIVQGRRVGITKATELPWRFCVAGSRYLSRAPRR